MEDACSNCSCMPLAKRTARLVKFEAGLAEKTGQLGEDTLSIAASGNLFPHKGMGILNGPERSSFFSVSDPHGAGVDSWGETEGRPSRVTEAIQLAVSRFGLDAAPVEAALSSTFWNSSI